MLLCRRLFQFTLRFVLISLLTVGLVLGWSAIAQSQLPALPTRADNGANLPSDVERHGEYETASVRSPLDNQSGIAESRHELVRNRYLLKLKVMNQ